MKLNPTDLSSFIAKDNRFKRAEALLTDQWELLLLSEPWGMTMMTRSDIVYAKALVASDAMTPTVDLTTFKGIQQFIQRNAVRLSPDVVTMLKEPFL